MPGITIQITGEGAGAAEALRVIEERMQQTARRGNEMSDQLAMAGRRIQEVFGAIGIGFGIERVISGLKDLVSNSIEAAVQIGHLSQQTGISAENLSVLKYAASQTGVEFETFTKGFKKLSTEVYNADTGSKKAEKTFRALGVSQADLTAKGNDMYAVLSMVADKFKEMPDGIEKNALASQLFGRAGQQLIPVLDQGAAGVERFRAEAEQLGLVLDDKGIQKMEELHREVDKLQSAYKGLGLELTSALAPALETIAKLIPQVFGVGGQGAHGNDFSAGIDAMARGLRGLVRDLAEVGLLQEGDFEGARKLEAQWAAQNIAEGQTGRGSAVDRLMGSIRPGGANYAPGGKIPGDDAAAIEAANKQAIADAEIERHFEQMAQKDEAEANRLVAAGLRLAEARESAQLEVVKSGGKLRLAELDAEHRAGLVTEANYLREKLALDRRANDEEAAALTAKQGTLQAAITREGTSETVRKIELETQLAEVEAKIAALVNDRKGTEAQITAEMAQQTWQSQVQAAQLAIEKRHREEEQQRALDRTSRQGERYESNLDIEMSRQAAQTIGGFMDQLTSQAIQGRISFKSLVDSAVMDLERFAMKVLQQRMLMPILNSLFGLGMGNGAAVLSAAQGVTAASAGISTTSMQLPFLAGGGDLGAGDMAVVGDGGNGSGAELFAPKGPGTVLPHDVLEGIAKGGGGGGGAPSVTIHNVNNSSQAVDMKQGGVSYDAQARQFIIHTVLEDAASGGPVAGMLSGFSRG